MSRHMAGHHYKLQVNMQDLKDTVIFRVVHPVAPVYFFSCMRPHSCCIRPNKNDALRSLSLQNAFRHCSMALLGHEMEQLHGTSHEGVQLLLEWLESNRVAAVDMHYLPDFIPVRTSRSTSGVGGLLHLLQSLYLKQAPEDLRPRLARILLSRLLANGNRGIHAQAAQTTAPPQGAQHSFSGPGFVPAPSSPSPAQFAQPTTPSPRSGSAAHQNAKDLNTPSHPFPQAIEPQPNNLTASLHQSNVSASMGTPGSRSRAEGTHPALPPSTTPPPAPATPPQSPPLHPPALAAGEEALRSALSASICTSRALHRALCLNEARRHQESALHPSAPAPETLAPHQVPTERPVPPPPLFWSLPHVGGKAAGTQPAIQARRAKEAAKEADHIDAGTLVSSQEQADGDAPSSHALSPLTPERAAPPSALFQPLKRTPSHTQALGISVDLQRSPHSPQRGVQVSISLTSSMVLGKEASHSERRLWAGSLHSTCVGLWPCWHAHTHQQQASSVLCAMLRLCCVLCAALCAPHMHTRNSV